MAKAKTSILMCPDCSRVQSAKRKECYHCGRLVDASWYQVPTVLIKEAKPKWYRTNGYFRPG